MLIMTIMLGMIMAASACLINRVVLFTFIIIDDSSTSTGLVDLK